MSQSKLKVGDKVRYVKAGVFGAWSRDWAAAIGLQVGGVYFVSSVHAGETLCVAGGNNIFLPFKHFELANDEPTPGAVAPFVVPTEAQKRKAFPLATGCIDYFPDALLAVAELSRIGNEQHNPGTPLRWDRTKSTDEADALMRHFVDRGKLDTDGVPHSAKVAWRALALLQKEIEKGADGEEHF